MNPWSHDVVLAGLVVLPDPLGSLVAAYPGRNTVADDPTWIDDWFSRLVESYAAGRAPEEVKITASGAEQTGADLAILAKPPVERTVRLLAIEPRYFRGFRTIDQPVQLDADLVVIEGLNSSGKTSISEAIEWVFTGGLSRRSSGQYGHPRELANCISNEFRPDEESTWVELLISVDEEQVSLKRTLIQDYSAQQASQAVSELSVNGEVLDAVAEAALFDLLFAGLHPILMQHTLRQFVHDQPDARRQYFERLLQIDELTELISRSVVGDKSLGAFRLKGGSPAMDSIRALLSGIQNPKARKMFEDLVNSAPERAQEAFRGALVAAAVSLFPQTVGDSATFNQCKDALENAQAGAREAQLPLLGELRKPLSHSLPDLTEAIKLQRAVATDASALELATKAAHELDESKLAVSRAYELLVAAGLSSSTSDRDQECPLCLAEALTLTPARVRQLSSWKPLAAALASAKERLTIRQKALSEEAALLESSTRNFKIQLPATKALEEMIKNLAPSLQTAVHAACLEARTLSDEAERTAQSLAGLNSGNRLRDSVLTELSTVFQSYRDEMTRLEDLVAASARQETTYLARERWITATGTMASLGQELIWSAARKSAQARLERIRKGLIKLRAEIIEDARRTFSTHINEVWELLRSDTGAKFSQLRIPDARGKGYKLELEVKATISDGIETREVDALRVFSESQVNVIGIAAYVTRSRLLGHKLLIFDDPVQSMDEEHFRTFANTLVGRLLDEGFQLIILTHSEHFARRISYFHSKQLSYATLRTRFSKRRGCVVDEGSRRVSERLKQAKRFGDEGVLDRAWVLVRLGIERLYTLVMTSADETFDPESWRNATAESMWNEGAGVLIEAGVPNSGPRLKEILELSASGAHDKAATSQTDLLEAIDYLRQLPSSLRVGD